MSRKNLINGLLGLQGWEVMQEEVVVGEQEVVIAIVRSQGASCCCRGCGQTFLWAYDHLESRRVRDFPLWGRRRWGKAACLGVEAACTDLWSAYRNSVRRYLKHAQIVFDKFHVFSYLSAAIDQVRRDEQNRALKEEGLQLIKGSRWLWLKNRSRLRRKQRQSLDEIMAMNRNLHKAYLLKEDFAEFYACQNHDEAEAFLRQWTRRCKQSNLLPFQDLARRLTRWKEGILAYFKHRITNAVSEGINNKIKVLKRRSYGFHDFQYFVLKIMDATGALPSLTPIPHTIRE